MNSATAFAPGNVSMVFQIVANADPRRMHALGMGFTVSAGALVSVRAAQDTRVWFNHREINFPTVRTVVAQMSNHPMHVTIESKLPLSAGFGLSGASALASALAIDQLLQLALSREQLGMIAHVAEVSNLTGLGDVCGQLLGGCNLKNTAGAPLSATRLAIPEQPIWYRYFSPLLTRSIIGDVARRNTINAAASTALQRMTRLAQAPTNGLEVYIEVARQFALDSGLLHDPRVCDTIAAIQQNGGAASMIMLGNAVFSTTAFAGATHLRLSTAAARIVN